MRKNEKARLEVHIAGWRYPRTLIIEQDDRVYLEIPYGDCSYTPIYGSLCSTCHSRLEEAKKAIEQHPECSIAHKVPNTYNLGTGSTYFVNFGEVSDLSKAGLISLIEEKLGLKVTKMPEIKLRTSYSKNFPCPDSPDGQHDYVHHNSSVWGSMLACHYCGKGKYRDVYAFGAVRPWQN